uniref:Uncharacterized protein n=1 Tax=Oryza brachyantha TaxID=4533 RepID=J3MJ65_ORYBR
MSGAPPPANPAAGMRFVRLSGGGGKGFRHLRPPRRSPEEVGGGGGGGGAIGEEFGFLPALVVVIVAIPGGY